MYLFPAGSNFYFLKFKKLNFNSKILFILKDPISVFTKYIQNKNNNCDEGLLLSWDKRIKVVPHDFERQVNKPTLVVGVEKNENLAQKYLKQWVSCSTTPDHLNLKDDLKIINKKQSAILMYQNTVVGAVIRNAAVKNLSEHFGIKIKVATDSHPLLKRGDNHAYDGKMVGYGYRKDPIGSFHGRYVYEDKTRTPEVQKMLEDDEQSIAKWLYENGKQH